MLLADSKLWHNATPINAVSPKEEGYLDLFVLTARRESMTFTPELARRQFSALSQHIDGKPAIFSTAPAAHRFHGACWKNDGLPGEIQR